MNNSLAIETALAGGPAVARLIESAEALLPLLRERAAEGEAQRRLAPQVFAALVDAGLFRILQPARYGGLQAGLDDFCRLVFTIGRGDGAAAWVYSVVAMHSWHVGMFPAPAQDDVWGDDPNALVSTSYVPSGMARPDGDAFRLSGRWSFASGCDYTQWMLVGGWTLDADGERDRQCFFLLPRRDYAIVDNWDVVGLAGTGSKDIVIEDAPVPAHRVLRVEDTAAGNPPGAAVNPAPLFRVPLQAAISTCLCAPAVGIADGVLETYVENLKNRVTRGAIKGAGARVAELATIQLRVAEAAAAIDAAKLLLLRDAAETLAVVQTAQGMTTALRLRNRRDHAFAARLVTQVVDRLFESAGGTALTRQNALQRGWRDVHAASMHISTNWDAVGAMFGRFTLGLDPEGGGHY